jgi:ABC-type nitrate/sulfonate/bicarbonate transport system substrate-binding protein
MTKKSIWIGGIILALSLAIIGPVMYLKFASRSADTVKIATSKNGWCTLTLVALDIGLFEKHGLVPDTSYNAAGRNNMDALVSGSADVANIVEMNIANAAKAGEQDLQILGSIVRATDYAFVSHGPSFVARDGGDFGYLRGRRIGFAPGTGAEPFLFAVLQKHGIREDEVTLVPIPPSGLVDQFAAKAVDVAVTWEPFANTMKERMDGAVTIHRDRLAFKGIMTLAVRREWASRHPATVERLLAVYRDAQRFVEQNPDRAKAIVARQAVLPPGLVHSIWNLYEPKFITDDKADQAAVQAAINVISRARAPSQTDVDYRTYFKR